MSIFGHKHNKPKTPGFKSEAQRAKMTQLVAEGKLKPEVLSRWEQATPKTVTLPAKLPTLKKVKSIKRVT